MGVRKIALLCNNKMALPAMAHLADNGVLCGVATADTDLEVAAVIGHTATLRNVPYRKISRANYAQQLRSWIQDIHADVVFVMTFPWRIPLNVLTMPGEGFLNFHYGLLPQMRGADPVFESIRQQLTVAGITIHEMDEGLDTGPIVLKEEIQLLPEYTYGMLCSQLSWLGEKMCKQILKDMAGGRLASVSQNEDSAKYWGKLKESDLFIKWDAMTSKEIIALVRACNPVARGVPTTINGWKIGVCDASEVNLEGDASQIKPGTVVAMDPQNGMVVFCRDGKGVKLDVIVCGEGVFPGHKLAIFGVNVGMTWGN